MSATDPSDTFGDQRPQRFEVGADRAAAEAAAALANVDQLPLYRPGPPGGSITASDLVPLVAREIADEPNKDLLLYVHVPFCKYKCTFCDWVADIPTRQLTSGRDSRQTYVDALCRQIRHLGPRLMGLGYVPRYIYWGGGTPTRLDGPQFRQIVGALGESLDLSRVKEHVMEATPDSLSVPQLEAMRDVGVGRISMGVQSFDATELRKAGRGHSPEQADRAVEMMRAVGFDNFNIDLIVAFPDQSFDVLRRSLQRAVAHRPTHVTAYVYRPTPATYMAQRNKKDGRVPGGPQHMLDCHALTKEVLRAAGYDEYTLGYFSRGPENRCSGEMYYFYLQGDWVGFGGGAVSILGHHRLKISHSSLAAYIADPLTFESCERLPERQVEAAIYALRQALVTDAGVNFENFRRFFGFPFSSVRDHPAVRAFMGYYKYCGAVFNETPTNLAITPASRAAAYMRVWSNADAPAGDAAVPAASAAV